MVQEEITHPLKRNSFWRSLALDKESTLVTSLRALRVRKFPLFQAVYRMLKAVQDTATLIPNFTFKNKKNPIGSDENIVAFLI